MTEPMQTNISPFDENAVAKCRVLGITLMVVGICWFLRFLPFLVSRLYFPLDDYYPFNDFVVKCVLFFVGLGIVACSFQILKRRCYWLAFFAPLACLSLFVFSCLTLFVENWNFLNEKYTHPYYHLMDGMVPTEEVTNIAGYFVDYSPQYYFDKRQSPNVEIPVNIALFFLAPTTLIGFFGLYTLLTPCVRRSFSVPLPQRMKMKDADDKTQMAYGRTLSRSYAVLMFLLWIPFLPTTVLDFLEPDRHDYLMPPVNVFLNYAIVGCMIIGILSYFMRRYYPLALLAPLAWLASSMYFWWQIAWEYKCAMIYNTDSSFHYYYTLCFYCLVLIVLISRFTFCALGVWIWWKNQKMIKQK